MPGEPRRRWFNDEAMDLYVWLDDDGYIGFQLTYGKPRAEKALTWKLGDQFTHTGVDDGSRPGRHPGSPILVADGVIDVDSVLHEFRERAKDIDVGIAQFVISIIEARYKESARVTPSLVQNPMLGEAIYSLPRNLGRNALKKIRGIIGEVERKDAKRREFGIVFLLVISLSFVTLFTLGKLINRMRPPYRTLDTVTDVIYANSDALADAYRRVLD